MVAQRTGAVLRFARLGADEALTADSFRQVIGPRTRLVATAHVSNTLGARISSPQDHATRPPARCRPSAAALCRQRRSGP